MTSFNAYSGPPKEASAPPHPEGQVTPQLYHLHKTNDLILNLTPENMTQHSRIE